MCNHRKHSLALHKLSTKEKQWHGSLLQCGQFMLMMDFMEGLVPGENYYGLTILGGWGAYKKGILRYKMLGKQRDRTGHCGLYYNVMKAMW